MNQNLQIPQEVRAFLEGLLDDAQMVSLNDKMREDMISELYTRLDNFITTTIVDNMPSEHLEAFIKLNEEKRPQDEIETFLKEKMPNYKEVFNEAFAKFRNLYLGNVALERNKPAN